MKKYIFLAPLLLSIILFFQSCGDDDEGSTTTTTNNNENCMDVERLSDDYLEYEYFNPEGAMPSISTEPNIQRGDIYVENASAILNGNDVDITIPGIRVRTSENNYEILKFQIDEKDSGNNQCWKKEEEFSSGSSFILTDISSVLVLDMSTSLLEIIDELKSYAKNYARTVVNSSSKSQVALIFFSARDAIEKTDFYTSQNINELEELIDNFNNYQERTALYQATKEGIDLIVNTEFDGEESMLIFTDGGDNDSNNPQSLIQEIKESDISRFAIGLSGSDFVSGNLFEIADEDQNVFVANDESALESVFDIVGRGVISVYDLIYKRSDQSLNSNEKVRIRISVESKIIE